MKLIGKDTLLAEIYKLKKSHDNWSFMGKCFHKEYENLLSFIDTLEVKDPYEQCVQYDSIKAGIQAHAETYSFNIESELFNQLTKEQQKLWRKEIEQAVISGGEMGVELARDMRYKENLEVKEVDLEKECFKYFEDNDLCVHDEYIKFARYFFELGLKAQITQ